jgi:aldehyde dehydrogenase (NAD+)
MEYERFLSEEYGPYIDGEMRDGVGTFTVTNPATNEAVATVAESGAARVDKAITSAQEAFTGWRKFDQRERGRLLMRVADTIRENETKLATLETLENGRPLEASRKRVETAARYFEYFAGMTDKIQGESIPVEGQRLDYTVREPLGVSGQVIPWNSSLLLGARGFGPALAAGNTVVAKADPNTPLSLLTLAELLHDAGLPDGVFNVVPGDVEPTGVAFSSDSRLGNLVFTGSVPGGTAVMKAAADNIVPVLLELGGKSPSIVFPDADMERAVEGTRNVFGNAGQVCFATTRVFVHEDIHDEFAERLVAATEELTVGPGEDNYDIGPLISPEAQQRVERYVDEAVDDGATVLTGGEIPREEGNFYAPTILTDVDDSDAISCEEVFGPVLNLYTFSDENEVVRRANDTEFGLYGTVWTTDIRRGHRVADEIRAGTVSVNEFPVTPPGAPFGGYKKSGIGREKGLQALDHYTETKNVVVNLEE